jgi:hypothetical protein
MATRHSPFTQVRQRSAWYVRLRRHKPLAALVISAMLLLTPALVLFNVSAASSYASPLFQAQWAAGEALVPNFWGPLPLARDGQQEPYVEAPGGQRLVQYFDKARMELTNPATGTVTNGLLATELITGNRQLGDNTFANVGPANIPVAGDPTNAGPTYAMIQTNAAQLRVSVTATVGSPVTVAMTPSGTLSSFPNGSSFPQANIAGYDGTTQHNVPAAFQNFRNTAGLLTIGLAISEPFWSNVKVAGNDTQVLIQAFERRVLTYTPSNPAAFQVEMGNIGAHYYQWRYVTNPDSGGTATGTGTSTATTPAATTPAATTPAATTPAAAAPPTLSSVAITNITTTGAHVTFTTDVPACGTVEYRVAGTATFTTDIGTITCGTPSMSFAKDLSGLSPTTNYEVRGAAYTSPGSIGYSSVAPMTTLTPDTTGPVISAIAWTAVDKNNIKLTFALNEAGTAKVKFGTAADLSGASTVDATNTSGNNFSATFGVVREKQYYYQITATDTSSNSTNSLVKQVQLNRTLHILWKSVTVKENHYAPPLFLLSACTPSYTYDEAVKYATGAPNTQTDTFTMPYTGTVPHVYSTLSTRNMPEDLSRAITISVNGHTNPDAGSNPACAATFPTASQNLTAGSDWNVGGPNVVLENAEFKAEFSVTDTLDIVAP